MSPGPEPSKDRKPDAIVHPDHKVHPCEYALPNATYGSCPRDYYRDFYKPRCKGCPNTP